MKENDIKEETIEGVCRIIENRCRQLGKDCQIIFANDGVSVAPLSWSGDAFDKDLYTALLDAEKCCE
jgi:hypothetical protein